ncbi:MAG: ParB N-terminal domain-containing protein [Planctomycetes bacterium]|nr:ParB N-terminal domain-containing protein [Planctomycetota bacterium]
MSDKARKIVEWPVAAIDPHPENRPVNDKSPRYAEIRESIRTNGIQQPLIVRTKPGASDRAQCLCGHHRLAIAQELGMATVPVDHRGVVTDAQAFEIMAISNLHIPLTPLEEGQRAAKWLDHYDQDAQAVAAKLGKTARWVVEHAQIYRNLTADWRKAAGEIPAFDRWTAAHWAVIAKLPPRIQGEQLAKFRNNAFCSYDRWSVKELENRIGHKTFLLAKAPFPRESCAGCVNRTGQQPLFLWADTPEGATGDQERCLDVKCWQRKCEKADREAFKRLAQEKGLESPLPLCLLKEPKDCWSKEYDEYRAGVSACRRAHKGLVLCGDVKIVKEGTKGAVPAIVVAGVGKNTVKHVVVQKERTAASRPRPQSVEPTAAELKRRRDQERWDRVCDAAIEKIRAMPAPCSEAILLLTSFIDPPATDPHKISDIIKAWKEDRTQFETMVREWFWSAIVQRGGLDFFDGAREGLEQIGPLFGIDIDAQYQAMVEADARQEELRSRTQTVAVALPKSVKASCDLRVLEDGGAWHGGYAIEIPQGKTDLPADTLGESYPSKAHALKAMAEAAKAALDKLKTRRLCPAALHKQIAGELDKIAKACELELQRTGQGPTPGVCRVCGCTDADCSGCVERTSEPCHWVDKEHTLCSACAGNESRATSHGSPVKPSGLIENPEKIRVEMDKAWKAAVTIKIAQVDGLWYVGWDAHVPGEGSPMPCSTAHHGYTLRNDALSDAHMRLTAWLDGKPGRKGYKHHDAIKEALRVALGAAMDNKSGQGRCDPAPAACDVGCLGCEVPAKSKGKA